MKSELAVKMERHEARLNELVRSLAVEITWMAKDAAEELVGASDEAQVHCLLDILLSQAMQTSINLQQTVLHSVAAAVDEVKHPTHPTQRREKPPPKATATDTSNPPTADKKARALWI